MIVIGGETTIVCYDVYNVMYLWVEKDISELDEAEIPNLIASTHGVEFKEDSKILIPIPIPQKITHKKMLPKDRHSNFARAALSNQTLSNGSDHWGMRVRCRSG
jgi:hypothetical protein